MKTDNQPAGDKLEKACLDLVIKHNMKKSILFSAFEAESIQRIKQYDPEISTALLFNHSANGQKMPSKLVEQYKANAFHCTYPQLTKKRVADLKKHDIPVIVYTVNNETTMKKLIALEVNGIITDRPNLLKRIISKSSSNYEK